MKKFILFFLIISVVISLFSSCEESKSAEDVLLSITKNIESLPYGILYLKSAVEGEPPYLPSSTIRSLFYEGADSYEFTLIEDYAIYICPKKPCEVAVYKCFSSSDTDLIATMCLKRIDMLKILLEETPYKDIPKNARVDINGKFVSVTMT